MRKAIFNKKNIGILISIVFICLIFWNIDFRQLINTFKIFNYRVLIWFVLLYIISLYIRGYRWKSLLCGKSKLTLKDAFFTFTSGNTINSYFPARAGDIWRAYHIGNKYNESKMKMLGSIILERIIDGISVLLILSFAVLTYFRQPWVINLTYITASLFLGSLIACFLILRYNKVNHIFDKIKSFQFLSKYEKQVETIRQTLNNFIKGLEALNSIKYFSLSFLSSCIAWSIECILTYILILGFGHDYGISIAFFVISFIALSTIIPSSSIFIGPYQYAYILALGIYHFDKSNALAIAFIHQITIMIITTIITIIYFNITSTNIKNIQSEIKETENAVNT